MHARIFIDVELEKVAGTFAKKEELVGKIMEDVEAADPGTVYADNDSNSEYSITGWDVSSE